MMGSKGLTEASKTAILKANYMAKRLEVCATFQRLHLHVFLFTFQLNYTSKFHRLIILFFTVERMELLLMNSSLT